METFLNSLPDSFYCSGRLPAIRVFKNIISSGVQDALGGVGHCCTWHVRVPHI